MIVDASFFASELAARAAYAPREAIREGIAWVREGNELGSRACRARSTALARSVGRLWQLQLDIWLQTDVLPALVRLCSVGSACDGLFGSTESASICSLGITEPDVGSQLSALCSTVSISGSSEGEYSGIKSAVSMGALADSMLAVAREAGGLQHLKVVHVDLADPAVSTSPIHAGSWNPWLACIRAEFLRVTVLNPTSDATLAIHRALSIERFFIALMLHEAARSAIAELRGALRRRHRTQSQGRTLLAALDARSTAIDALLIRIETGYWAGSSPTVRDAAIARYLASELAFDVARVLVDEGGTEAILHSSSPRSVDRLESVIAFSLAGGSQATALELIAR